MVPYFSDPRTASSKWLLLAAFAMYGNACQTIPEVNPALTYKKQMGVEVDGHEYHGLGVLPKRAQYHLEIKTPQKPRMVLVTTDHRDLTFVKPGKEVELSFAPLAFEERIDISALDDKGEHDWAMLFIIGDETLPALLECNGDSYRPSQTGMSVCQSRIGLLQQISFDDEVAAYAPERCSQPQSEDHHIWQVALSEGICQYVFDDGLRIHRFVTYGYEEVLIRDD